MKTLRLSLVCAILAAMVRPVYAGDPSEGAVRLDVLPGWSTQGDGQVAALRLTLAEGWKTYWRAPGDAGIPPQFSWKGSHNLDTVQVQWPTPLVFDQNGMRSVGYKDELVIPLTLARQSAGRDIRLKGSIDIGVCSDICVPERLHFDAVLPAGGTTRDAVIAGAIAQAPLSAQEAGVKAATCRLTPATDGVNVDAELVLPSAGGPEFVVIEGGSPDIWSAETTSRRVGNTLSVSGFLAHFEGGGFAVNRSAMRLTVIGSNHTVDIQGCAAG